MQPAVYNLLRGVGQFQVAATVSQSVEEEVCKQSQMIATIILPRVQTEFGDPLSYSKANDMATGASGLAKHHSSLETSGWQNRTCT